jgi:hypothetical protein
VIPDFYKDRIATLLFYNYVSEYDQYKNIICIIFDNGTIVSFKRNQLTQVIRLVDANHTEKVLYNTFFLEDLDKKLPLA